MVFSSILFLFAFLPVVLLLYMIVPKKIKNIVLLLASIFFYAWGEPIYVFLMLYCAVFNYVIGLDISQNQKRNNLVFGIIINVFILFYFKYAGFALSIFHLPSSSIALPIGISFYTFQNISYLIDVYKKKIKVQSNFFDYALYITMFPQLIAGPIVRYSDIEGKLKDRTVSINTLGLGAEIFVKGLAKKVLLANNIGSLATNIQTMSVANRSAMTAWLGAIAYTFQIYYDFSGYSDMAIGLGKMFGFDFKVNFNHPYLSKSLTEFWRRWHISLGDWFREYIYIPLGGNRVSFVKHIRNILVVWLLTGLWHGASWNFILWGLYYGIILLLEKYVFANFFTKLPDVVLRIYTMVLIIIGWVLFMSNTLGDAGAYLSSMFGGGHGIFDGTAFYYIKTYGISLIICCLCAGNYLYSMFKKIASRRPIAAVAINVVLLLLSISYLVYDTYNPFLYFRF